jgi:hypothetical protein
MSIKLGSHRVTVDVHVQVTDKEAFSVVIYLHYTKIVVPGQPFLITQET